MVDSVMAEGTAVAARLAERVAQGAAAMELVAAVVQRATLVDRVVEPGREAQRRPGRKLALTRWQ